MVLDLLQQPLFLQALHEKPAAFEMFFREMPYQGGYAVFAGLQTALEYLAGLAFTAADVQYLASLELFDDTFLEFLREFRFRGRVTAPREGEIVFAGEPLLTVEGTLAETQFVESVMLNIINFQTLVATKGGLRRRGREWLPDGRPEHLTAACEASLAALNSFRLQLPDGGRAPLFTVASVEESRAYSSIRRIDGRRVVTVSADVDQALSTPNIANETILSGDIGTLNNNDDNVANVPLRKEYDASQREALLEKMEICYQRRVAFSSRQRQADKENKREVSVCGFP